MSINQFRFNNHKDLGETLILKHFLDIFPAFKKLCSLDFLCLFIIALQI